LKPVILTAMRLPTANGHDITQERSYKVENEISSESPPDRLANALRWAKRLETGGYVYLVQAGDFIKVGIARDVKRRIDLMQVGCPFKIELIAAIPCADPRKIERALHDKLKPYHSRGEWYVALRSEVDAAVAAVIG
jgi:hypothetical protein